MKTLKQHERMRRNKRNNIDIITKLIDSNLEDIAGDILGNLSDVDMANAVMANKNWSSIATGRGRVKRLFSSRSKIRNAPLKALYRREELLARQERQESSDDARSLFLRASAKCYADLGKFHHADPIENKDEFRLVFPFDCSAFEKCRMIHATDRFIAAAVYGLKSGNHELRHYHSNVVLVFDRWTFQLVNSLTIESGCPLENLRLIDEGGVNALFFSYCSKGGESRAFLWHLATGKLHAMPCPASTLFDAYPFGRLIVLVATPGGDDEEEDEGEDEEGDDEEDNAYVYRVIAEGDNMIVCFLGHESLHAFDVYEIPSADLDWFVVAIIKDENARSVWQMRSKEDFTLLRTVTHLNGSPSLIHNSAFAFNECFAFVFDYDDCYFVDVVSLTGRHRRTVYRFCVPPRTLYELMTGCWPDILTTGRFLVLYSEGDGRLRAVIWKLPLDFIETCHRHLKEGTVGMTENCDQVIVDEKRTVEEPDVIRANHLQCRFDRFGILKCSVSLKRSEAVVSVVMLDSIISDEDVFRV